MADLTNEFLLPLINSQISRISFALGDWYFEFDSEHYMEIFAIEDFIEQFGSLTAAVNWMYEVIGSKVDEIEFRETGDIMMSIAGRKLKIPKENINLESFAVSIAGDKRAI